MRRAVVGGGRPAGGPGRGCRSIAAQFGSTLKKRKEEVEAEARGAGTGVCQGIGAEACPKKEVSRRTPAARAASDGRSRRRRRPGWRCRSRLESGLAVIWVCGFGNEKIENSEKVAFVEKGDA